MATRSSIIRKNKDNSYDVIYCHWDGYLENNGINLSLYYGDGNEYQRNKLFELGDLSSLGMKIDPETEEHSFEKPENNVCVFYGRDRGETNVSATHLKDYDELEKYMEQSDSEYYYLYDEKRKEWLFKEYYSANSNEFKKSVFEGLYHNIMDIGSHLYKHYIQNAHNYYHTLYKTDSNGEKDYGDSEYKNLIYYGFGKYTQNGYLNEKVIDDVESILTTKLDDGSCRYSYNLNNYKNPRLYTFQEYMTAFKEMIDKNLESTEFDSEIEEEQLKEAKFVREKLYQQKETNYHLDFGFDPYEYEIEETEEYKKIKEAHESNKTIGKNMPRSIDNNFFKIIATTDSKVRDEINKYTNYSGFAFEGNGFYKLYVPSGAMNCNRLTPKFLKDYSQKCVIAVSDFTPIFSYNEDGNKVQDQPSIIHFAKVSNGKVDFEYRVPSLNRTNFMDNNYYSLYPYEKEVLYDEYQSAFMNLSSLIGYYPLNTLIKNASEEEFEPSRETLTPILSIYQESKLEKILNNFKKDGYKAHAEIEVKEAYNNYSTTDSPKDERYITSYITASSRYDRENSYDVKKEYYIRDRGESNSINLFKEYNQFIVDGKRDNLKYSLTEESLLPADRKAVEEIGNLDNHSYLREGFSNSLDLTSIKVKYNGYVINSSYSITSGWLIESVFKENPKSDRSILTNTMSLKHFEEKLKEATTITNNSYYKLGFDYEMKKGDIKGLDGALALVKSVQEKYIASSPYFYPQLKYYKVPVEEIEKLSYEPFKKKYFIEKNIDLNKVEELSYNEFADKFDNMELLSVMPNGLAANRNGKVVDGYQYFASTENFDNKLSLSDKINKMVEGYYNTKTSDKDKAEYLISCLYCFIGYNSDKIQKELNWSDKDYHDYIDILISYRNDYSFMDLERLQNYFNPYPDKEELKEPSINAPEDSYFNDLSITKDVWNPDLEFDEALYVLDNNKVLETFYAKDFKKLFYNIIDNSTLEKEFDGDKIIQLDEDNLTFGNIKPIIDNIIKPLGENVKVVEINHTNLEEFMDSVEVAMNRKKNPVNSAVIQFLDEDEIKAIKLSPEEFEKKKAEISQKQRLSNRNIYFTKDDPEITLKPYKVLDNTDYNNQKYYEFATLNSVKRYCNTNLDMNSIIELDGKNKVEEFKNFRDSLHFLMEDFKNIALTEVQEKQVIKIKDDNYSQKYKEESDLIQVIEDPNCVGFVELDPNSEVLEWQNTNDQGFWFDEYMNIKDNFEDNREMIKCNVIDRIMLDDEKYISVFTSENTRLADYGAIPLEEAIVNIKHIYLGKNTNELALKDFSFDRIDFSEYNGDYYELLNTDDLELEYDDKFLRLKDLTLAMTDKLQALCRYAFYNELIDEEQLEYLNDEVVDVFYGSSTMSKIDNFLNNNQWVSSHAPKIDIDSIDLSNIEKLFDESKVNIYIADKEKNTLNYANYYDVVSALEEQLNYYNDEYSYKKLGKSKMEMYEENSNLIYDLQTFDPDKKEDLKISSPNFELIITPNHYNYYSFNPLKHETKDWNHDSSFERFLKDKGYYKQFIIQAQDVYEEDSMEQVVEDVLSDWTLYDYLTILEKINNYSYYPEYEESNKQMIADFQLEFNPLEDVALIDDYKQKDMYYYIAKERSDEYDFRDYSVKENFVEVSREDFIKTLDVIKEKNKEYLDPSVVEEEVYSSDWYDSYHNFTEENIKNMLEGNLEYTPTIDTIDIGKWHFIMSKEKLDIESMFEEGSNEAVIVLKNDEGENIYLDVFPSGNGYHYAIEVYNQDYENIDGGGAKDYVGMEWAFNFNQYNEKGYVKDLIDVIVDFAGFDPKDILSVEVGKDIENVINSYNEFENELEEMEINELMDKPKVSEWYLEEYGDKIEAFKENVSEDYESIIKDYIIETLHNNNMYVSLSDFEIALYGSKIFGNNPDYNSGDIDVLVEFSPAFAQKYNLREDDLLNMLNGEDEENGKFMIENLEVDFNPILSEKSGNLEEHLIEAKQYWAEKNAKLESEKDNPSSNDNSNAKNEIYSLRDMYYNNECAGWIFNDNDESKCWGSNSNDLGLADELNTAEEEDTSDKMILERKIEIEKGQYIYVGSPVGLTIKDIPESELKPMDIIIEEIKEAWKIASNNNEGSANQMKQFTYSTKEINDYINTLPREKEIIINDKYSMEIHEDYVEESYEYFIEAVENINLMEKTDNPKIIGSTSLFDWKGGIRNGYSYREPRCFEGFEEIFNQLKEGKTDIVIPEVLENKIQDDIQRQIMRKAFDEYNARLYEYDPNMNLSTITSNHITSYYISRDSELTSAINMLEKKSDDKAKELIEETINLLKTYHKDYYERTYNNPVASNSNEELIYSNVNESEEFNNSEKYVLISKNSWRLAKEIVDEGVLDVSPKTNHTYTNVAYDLELGKTETYIKKIDEIFELRSQLNSEWEKKLDNIKFDLEKIGNLKINGNPEFKYDYKKLSSNQIKILLANELDNIDLNNPDNLKSLTKFVSGYKNINNFSLSNKLLIFVQEYERLGEDLFNPKNPMIYKSFDEWKELGKDVSVRKGQKALISVIPQQKTETIYFTEEKGSINNLPKTISKEETKEREKLFEEGKLKKMEQTTLSYVKMPKYFRIDQTNLALNNKTQIVMDYKKSITLDEKNILNEKLNLLANDLNINTNYNLSMKNNNKITSTEAKAINDNNFESYKNNVDVNIAMNLYNINNKVLHSFMIELPKEEQLSKSEMEAQTDLATRVSLEKLGVNSNVMDKVYSLSGYDKVHNIDHENINYNEMPKDMLIANMEIAEDMSNRLFAVLENGKDEVLIANYIPDQLKQDKAGNYYLKAYGFKNILNKANADKQKNNDKDNEKEL